LSLFSGRREEWIGREKTPPPDYLETGEEESKGKQRLSWWRRLLNRLLLTSRGKGQAAKKGEKQQENRLEYL